MTDLSEFVGDTPMRASLVKKMEKAQAKYDAIMLKAEPIMADVQMYAAMIAAIDARIKIAAISEDDPDAISPEQVAIIAARNRESASKNPSAENESPGDAQSAE